MNLLINNSRENNGEYFAKTITEVCSIFGVDKENYEDKYGLFNGYSSLDYFADVIENING